MHETRYQVIFIVGPTSIGKTEISVELAELIDAEIVSADSMQVYRQLDIGTSKPHPNGVEYHLVDFVDLNDRFNAYRYFNMAIDTISEIVRKGKTAIVSGGTGLYVESIIKGIFPQETPSRREISNIRKDLNDCLQTRGVEHLYQQLMQVDPESAKVINPKDSQRIIRALEVFYSTGQNIKKLQENHDYQFQYSYCMIGLTCNRQALYRRIEKDVRQRFDAGWIDEVKELVTTGLSDAIQDVKPIGYLQILKHLNSKGKDIDLENIVEKIVRITRNYAKRQLTWFKRYDLIRWVNRTFDLQMDLDKIISIIDLNYA